MNQKTYKVWKYLLTYPNQWLSVYTISSELRLTFRQVISVLSGINSEYILKEHTGDGVEVCLDADEETLALLILTTASSTSYIRFSPLADGSPSRISRKTQA